jgi:predicted solute-binding protein
MPTNPFVEERKKNKALLSEMMRKLDNIDERRVLALFSSKTGISLKTAEKYFEEIKDALGDDWKEELKREASEKSAQQKTLNGLYQ